jgi:hypothetical protein
MPEHHVVHDAVEEIKHLEHEAEEGESARTPALIVGGISMVVTVIVVVVLALAFIAYYVTK